MEKIFRYLKYMQCYISTIMIGCLAAALFMIAFWLAMQSKERFGLSEPLSEQTALVIAAMAIMPLWLPLLWKRLTRLKLGPLEFDLSEFGIKGRLTLAEELNDVKALQMGPSYIPNLIDKIAEAISEAEMEQVAEIHFGIGKTQWWSTRLYLLAALAKDYTEIRQFIFLESCDDRDRLFVGSATPTTILHSIGLDNPRFNEAYQEAKKKAHKHDAEEKEKLAWIAQHFVWQFESDGGEEKAKEIVDRQFLRRCSPMIEAIEWLGGPPKIWIVYQIINRSEAFVSLTKPDGQLDLVIDRLKLAQQAAKASLRMQLDYC